MSMAIGAAMKLAGTDAATVTGLLASAYTRYGASSVRLMTLTGALATTAADTRHAAGCTEGVLATAGWIEEVLAGPEREGIRERVAGAVGADNGTGRDCTDRLPSLL